MITRALLWMLPPEAAGDLLEEAHSRGDRWLLWQTSRSLWWAVTESWRRGQIAGALAKSLGGVLLPVLLLDRFWAFVYSQVPLRDGLGREPWMLALNVAVAGASAFVCRGSAWTTAMLPVAASAAWWYGMADAGLAYGLPLVGACALAGRGKR